MVIRDHRGLTVCQYLLMHKAWGRNVVRRTAKRLQIIKDSHLRDHAPFHVDLEYRRQPTRIEEPPEYWNFDLFAMAKTEARGVE